MTLSSEVQTDIKQLLADIKIETPKDVNGELCDTCKSGDTCEYDCNAMQLTVATNEAGDSWNYQTGDNSFTGGAYGLTHWAVVHISHDSDRDSLTTEVIDQLEELLAE